jgi:phosphate transport system protein
MPPLHTDKEYEAEFARLREHLLLMGAHVESQLTAALTSFATQDAEAAQAVTGRDAEIDRIEVQIDNACVDLLATRQPVAKDLRFVLTSLKVVTDLERIGDLAGKVARLVAEGVEVNDSEARRLTEDMGRAVTAMLHDAIDGLVESDVYKAEAVIQRDDAVDETCAGLLKLIAQGIMRDVQRVEAYLRLHTVARSIERIGDHCTNVAEMVVFLVRGQHVRHLRHSVWMHKEPEKLH